MVVILFNNAEPFKQIINNPSTEGLKWNLLKTIQMVSGKKTFKDYSFIHINSPGAREDNPRVIKFWLLLKEFTTLFIHDKFQPLVFNTFWEHDASTLPHTDV